MPEMRWIRAFIGGLIVPVALSLPAAADDCLDCHELAAISPGGTVVHPPFAEKDCGSCHADHGDQERLVLTEEGNALCAQCMASCHGERARYGRGTATPPPAP